MMFDDPLVTVYITNFNYGSYIRQAIESVLNQSFSDWELIIIDDGSTDDSRAIIRQYQGTPHVRIIFQKNKGLNATNNIAVKAARGKYIMRLDADDYLDENALLVMTAVLDREPLAALVFPDYYYVDAEGRVTGQERRHNFQTEVTLLDQPAHGACTLIRRDCLIEVNAYSDSYRCQDGYDLWLKVIDRYAVRNINLPLFYYRRHGTNLTESESLILETRSKILEAHANRTSRPRLKTTCVIPVLGRAFDPGCLSLEPLGGRPLIDWTIDAALTAKGIDETIISSPDEGLLRHVAQRFGDRISLHLRLNDGNENAPFDIAVRQAMGCRRQPGEPDAIMVLTIDAPLRSSIYVEKAINAMRVFDVDVVIGVMPENDLYFFHDGKGLHPVGTSAMIGKLRYERDYLYRHAGGTIMLRKSFFDSHPSSVLAGTIGHIVIPRGAATIVRRPIDLKLAEVIRNHEKGA